MIADESVAWLKTLNESLWTTTRADRFGFQSIVNSDKVLSKEDFNVVLAVIKSHNLPCTAGSGPFGFGFSFTAWLPPEPAPYPGTESEFVPEAVVTICNRHLSLDKDSFWSEVVDPLVYSEDNVKRLEAAGLSKPEEKQHYEY